MGLVQLGATWLDLERDTLHRAGRILALTHIEAELLRHLAGAASGQASREELLAAVWDYGSGVKTHTLKTTVARLRAKLGEDRGCLQTLWGRGYGLRVEPAGSSPPSGEVTIVVALFQRRARSCSEAPGTESLLERVDAPDAFAFIDEPDRIALAFGSPAAAARWATQVLDAGREGLYVPSVGLATGTGAPPAYDHETRTRAEVLAESAAGGEARLDEACRAAVGDDVLAAGEALDASPAARTVRRMPLAPGVLIGRDEALKQLTELAAARRFVTIVGPGGAGKTRLALELAARTPAGRSVWFVDLSAARKPTEVVDATAVALALVPRGDPVAHIGRALAGRGGALLILDNCEQVADDVAACVVAWLSAAPDLSVLATSREALRVGSERRFVVEPLALPAGEGLIDVQDNPSVALLTTRASDRGAPVVPSAQNAAMLAEIVRRLDGLPLALELAAGHLPILGIAALLGTLARPLDAIRNLDRDRPARHDRLRVVLEWSWALLDSGLQGALAKLAVFRGGWTVESAAAVIGGEASDAVALLTALADRSLVRVIDREEGGRRFDLLATIRVFADEKCDGLGVREQAELRHLVWFAGAAPHMRREDPLDDLPNLVLAGNRALALDRTGEAAACAVAAHRLGALRRPQGAVLALLQRLPAEIPDAGRVPVLRALGRSLLFAGRLEAARATLDAAYEEAQNRNEPASASWVAFDRAEATLACGRMEEGWQQLRAAMEGAEGPASRFKRYEATGNLAKSHILRGQFDVAEPMIEEVVEGAVILGSDLLRATALSLRALLLNIRGQSAAGLDLAREAVRIADGADAAHVAAHARKALTGILLRLGLFAEAAGVQEDAVRWARWMGDGVETAGQLCNMAIVNVSRGRLALARASLREALAIAQACEAPAVTAHVAEALGQVALLEGDTAEARAWIDRAMQGYEATGYLRGRASALACLARCALADGQLETAAALADDAVSEAPDPAMRSICLLERSQVHVRLGWFDRVRDDLVTLEASELAPDERALSWCVAAELARDDGDIASARERRDQAAQEAIRMGVSERSALGKAIRQLATSLGG